jgi:Zn-finger nucleic acid-binding protein
MATDCYMEVSVEVCPNCAGVWVNPEELVALLRRDPAAFAHLEDKELPKNPHGPGDASKFQCPDCHQYLQEYHYMFNSPVVLHNCPTCSGFFVEDGQLKQMQDVVDAAHKPITPQEEAKIALGQMEAEKETYLIRQQGLRSLFWSLGRYSSGWWMF